MIKPLNILNGLDQLYKSIWMLYLRLIVSCAVFKKTYI